MTEMVEMPGRGHAVTKAVADEGAHVVAGSRTTGSLDDLKGVSSVAVDLSAPDGPAELIRRAVAEHDRLDVLVNNVGAVRMRIEGFFGTSDEDFAWALQMNFFIALRTTRAALTAMVERRSGGIVNVASINAFFQHGAAIIDYGAAKAALVDLTKTLSQELARAASASTRCRPARRDRLWLGEHRVAETVAKATGVGADTARQTIIADIGGCATGRFSAPEECQRGIRALNACRQIRWRWSAASAERSCEPLPPETWDPCRPSCAASRAVRGNYEAAVFVDPDVRAMSELIESERLAWGPGNGGAGYQLLLSTWEGMAAQPASKAWPGLLTRTRYSTTLLPQEARRTGRTTTAADRRRPSTRVSEGSV